MMSLGRVRAMAREAIALGRNYKHAALIRRYVRAKYGKVVVSTPSVIIGDALLALEHARWSRLAVLALLVVVAVRR